MKTDVGSAKGHVGTKARTGPSPRATARKRSGIKHKSQHTSPDYIPIHTPVKPTRTEGIAKGGFQHNEEPARKKAKKPLYPWLRITPPSQP